MTFLSKVFKSKDASKAGAKHKVQHVDTSRGQMMPPAKPRFVSTWNSKEIVLEEVEELIHVCTLLLKSRAEALDTPFLLLPYRPETDTAHTKTFINNFFKANREGSRSHSGASLGTELVLTDIAVLCSILKWCWSRMPGGIVTWPVYSGFSMGERDSNMARHAFHTFVPLSVDSEARKNIIYDFFDLLTAIAAHGKTNGLGGRKLSRMAGWWAFEQSDDGKGFEGGYRTWLAAADASSHLFFGYLRSVEPEALDGFTGINGLPRSIQSLMAQTEYPPHAPALMQHTTPKVLMLVDTVSPGPFALLRRATNFEYRDKVLQIFSNYSDPLEALTPENRRVLGCIASSNHSGAARSHSAMGLGFDSLNNKPEETWSHFQDFGFSSIGDDQDSANSPTSQGFGQSRTSGLRSAPLSRAADAGRPTTPSWADFLNSGFVDDGRDVSSIPVRMLLPPDKVLPPIGNGPPRSSGGCEEEDLHPGELASITQFSLDDSFWWVWITSLAIEEPASRKSVFGRCALIETGITSGRWILLEEQIKSAVPEPEAGAYIAEKKSRFGFSRRGKSSRRKSAILPQKHDSPLLDQRAASTTPSKASMSPDQQARIRAAAASLAKQSRKGEDPTGERRGRFDDAASIKTSSILTLGLTSDAAPAMKWAHAWDKEEIRRKYLGDDFKAPGVAAEPHVSDDTAIGPTEVHVPSPSAQKQPVTVVAHEMPQSQEQANNAQEKRTSLINYASDAESPVDQVARTATLPSLSASITSERPVVQKATEVPAVPSVPKVTQVERKPVPVRANNVQNHPALRSGRSGQNPAGKETPAEKAAREAWEAKAASFSPDVLAHESKRPGGFKRMFSRKEKPDNEKRNSFSQPSSSTTTLAPPSESNVARKISLLRKKSAQAANPAKPNPEPLIPRRPVNNVSTSQRPVSSPSEISPLESNFSHGHHLEPETQLVTPVNTNDRSHAQDEFYRFDQGPLSAPAWTPRESVDSHLQAEEAYKADLEAGHLDVPGGFPETPAETPMESISIGYATTEPTYAPAQPATSNQSNRWAQIRKNAADRVAAADRGPTASVSEEQPARRPSHLTTGTTDDGETSGEETLDERVARIKARVAHLTRNFEDPPLVHR